MAFTRFGGRMVKRERGRYEISVVPALIRAGKGPIASRYERVTFDLATAQPDALARADLLAPGHPLHDSVMDESVRRFAGALNSGTVLVSSEVAEPQLMVGVVEEVVDGTGASVSRRFGYAYVDSLGSVTPAGPAPYLDCIPASDWTAVRAARSLPWLPDAEDKAMSWIITHRLPGYLGEVRPRRLSELAKARELVERRLTAERARLLTEAAAAAAKERVGERPRESSDSLGRKAAELDHRLRLRLELIDQQSLMSTKPPLFLTAALVLPRSR
jgi:hypothetical protein